MDLNFASLDPEKLAEHTARNFFLMFGGVRQFDQWLSRTADFLAAPTQAPQDLARLGLLQLVPHLEMADFILANLDTLGVWSYRVEVTDRPAGVRVAVYDETWGHLVELGERPAGALDEAVQEFKAKYGPQVRVQVGRG